jgi:S1-C subfamily serine protease
LAAESKPERIYRKALPSVMTLEVENQAGERFVGSGVLALEDDIAVTAWHVVCDARIVWATFADGQRVSVIGCIDNHSELDLALLTLNRKFPRRRAVLSRNLQPVAAPAYVIGAPKGYGFSISDGLISQIRRVDGFPQYQVSCPISPGNSGGPLLNERGEVIGIASWTKSDAQNVSFAVPIGELAKLKPSSRVIPWDQLALLPHLPLAARAVEPLKRVVTARGNLNPAGGFEEFKKKLQNSTGKSVTVVLEEAGEENRFAFTVPQNGLR